MTLRHRLTVVRVAFLLLPLVSGCTAKPSSSTAKPGSGAVDNAPTDSRPFNPEVVRQLMAERDRLDQTVWADEVEAQRHESVFVRLWDRLRARDDDALALGEVHCDRITLGRLEDFQPLEQGIERAWTVADAAGEGLSASAWKSWLTEMSDLGYQLVQCEWHHDSFEPAEGEAPAKSIISMTLHVANPKTSEHLQIEGKLGVAWNFVRSPSEYKIREVDATRLKILRRTGPLPFEEALSLDLGPITGIENWSDLLVYDFTADQLPDVAYPAANRVFVNKGGFSFHEVPLCRHPLDFVSEAVLADFSGDGTEDLLCVGGREEDRGKLSLWLFRGERIDSSVADKQIEHDPRPAAGSSRGPAFPFAPDQALSDDLALQVPDSIAVGDVDGDRDLDIYLTQYKPPYRDGQVPTPYYDANDGWPAYLLLGDGHGNFGDATVAAGLTAKRHRRTYRSSFIDLDDDRDLDLLVTNDFAGFDIYHNDGKGGFSEVTGRVVDTSAVFGMSHTLADFDRDGRLDFYVVGMASTTARRLNGLGLGRDEFAEYQAMRMPMAYGNRMYLRDRQDTYRQPAWSDQVARSGWSWGVASEDFDLDGDADLYIANGHRSGRSALDYCTRFWCHDIYFAGSDENQERFEFLASEFRHIGQAISWNGYEKNHFFMQMREPSATVSDTAESGAETAGFMNVAFVLGVAEEADCRHVAATDFDRDGRPDLLVVRRKIDGGVDHLDLVLYRNVLATDGQNWIGVDLVGAAGAAPFGAMVHVITPGGPMVDAYLAGESFGVQHPPTLHFGLGRESTVREVRVDWPDGRVTTLKSPSVGDYHEIGPGG